LAAIFSIFPFFHFSIHPLHSSLFRRKFSLSSTTSTFGRQPSQGVPCNFIHFIEFIQVNWIHWKRSNFEHRHGSYRYKYFNIPSPSSFLIQSINQLLICTFRWFHRFHRVSLFPAVLPLLVFGFNSVRLQLQAFWNYKRWGKIEIENIKNFKVQVVHDMQMSQVPCFLSYVPLLWFVKTRFIPMFWLVLIFLYANLHWNSIVAFWTFSFRCVRFPFDSFAWKLSLMMNDSSFLID